MGKHTPGPLVVNRRNGQLVIATEDRTVAHIADFDGAEEFAERMVACFNSSESAVVVDDRQAAREPRKVLSRDEASLIVFKHTYYVSNYRVIDRATALTLMGDESYSLLLADPIRNSGPTSATLYYWNVIDYMCGAMPKGHRVDQ